MQRRILIAFGASSIFVLLLALPSYAAARSTSAILRQPATTSSTTPSQTTAAGSTDGAADPDKLAARDGSLAKLALVGAGIAIALVVLGALLGGLIFSRRQGQPWVLGNRTGEVIVILGVLGIVGALGAIKYLEAQAIASILSAIVGYILGSATRADSPLSDGTSAAAAERPQQQDPSEPN